MLETAVISSGVVGEAVLILPDFSEVNNPSDLFSVSANMGEEACIDDDLYNKIYDGMMERLKDKVAEIRSQAVTALQRLQDPRTRSAPSGLTSSTWPMTLTMWSGGPLSGALGPPG